jgi:hypothetical protein
MAILGRNTVSGFGNLISAESMKVCRFTLATAGRLDELYANVRCQSGIVNIRCVIYDDDGASGEPGTLLAVGADISVPITGSKQTRGGAVVTPAQLAAGNYWLGIHVGGDSGLEIDDDGVGVSRTSVTDAFIGGANNPWAGTSASSAASSIQVWGVVSVPVFYFSYSHSGDTIARTFNAYSFTGDTKADRYKGASPSNLAKKAWVYPSYTSGSGGGVSGGGGISIFTKP